MKKLFTYLTFDIFTFSFIKLLSINIVYADNNTQNGSSGTSETSDVDETDFLTKK